MANELAPQRAYIDAYEAMEVGRRRSEEQRARVEAAELRRATRQAAANALRDGMVDPIVFGNELARMGYASEVPALQQNLFGVQKSRGESMQAMGKGVQEQQGGIDAMLSTSRDKLANVGDQEGWNAWRSELTEAFPEFDEIIPQQFSPAAKQQSLMTADLLTKELEQIDVYGGIQLRQPITGEQVGETIMKIPYSDELAAQIRREAAIKEGREYNPEVKEVEDPDNPGQILLVDVKRWRGGGIGSPGVIGPKGRAPVEKGEKAGDAFGAVIDEMEQNYNELDRLGAIPSTRRSAQENLAISARTSQIGQMLGRASGTQEQSLRNQIQSARLRLLQGIKAATGMSAQELNSNVELQQWLDAVTNPANDVESNRAILNSIRSFVEANKPRGRAPAAPAREALSPRDQQALDWARKNPRDPRAAQIKQRLGVK